MIKVRVKENAWIAKMAAKKLGFSHIAMVIGRRIYLYNTPVSHFILSKRWVIHELKHVDQFEQYGFFGFLWVYLIEYIRIGYYENKFEIEARESEKDESLLLKYELVLPEQYPHLEHSQ